MELLVDTHCHLTFPGLADGNLDGVLARSRAAGVTRLVSVGTDLTHSEAAVALSETRPGVWATVGVHPHEADGWGGGAREALADLSGRSRVLAIGEIGLDFHYDRADRGQQERAFREQLDLAAESGLPVVIHSREAFEETLRILDRYGDQRPRAVLHCFSGTAEQARSALACGLYLSFTGVVTFKNAAPLREAAAIVPSDRLMIETDCPYLSPEPVRSRRPCEPAFLVHTARFLADLRGESLGDFCAAACGTSESFFGLSPI